MLGGAVEVSSVKRPGAIAFIGIVLYIQAFLAVAAGILMLAFQTRIKEILERDGVDIASGFLVGSGVVEIILAIALLVIAAGIMSGNRGVRFIVALVEGIRIIVAFVFMFFHHDGGVIFQAIVTIGISMFVLWALYIPRGSDEYFEAT